IGARIRDEDGSAVAGRTLQFPLGHLSLNKMKSTKEKRPKAQDFIDLSMRYFASFASIRRIAVHFDFVRFDSCKRAQQLEKAGSARSRHIGVVASRIWKHRRTRARRNRDTEPRKRSVDF